MEPAEKNQQLIRNAIEISIKIAAIFVMAAWCFTILRPFVGPIIWAAIIAVAVKPLCDWVENRIGGSRKGAAVVLTILMLAFIITPSIMLSGQLVENGQELTSKIQSGTLQVPTPNPKVREWPLVGEELYTLWERAALNLTGTIEAYRPQILELSKSAALKLAGVGVSLLVFVFSIVIAGVFLAGADGVTQFVDRLARRMAGESGKEFAALSSVTVRNVTQGILGVALFQATLAGIGFLVIGLPFAPLFALLVLIMSVIQLNPILLLLPLAIYVFSFASPVVATIYLVWSLVVGLMDNVLKPMIMGRGSKVPMMVVFLGAIGGFMASGIVGLFVGAVIVVLGYELFMAWMRAGETDSVDNATNADETPAA